MKHALTPLLIAAAFALSGCDKKQEPSGTAPAPAPAPSSQPAASIGAQTIGAAKKAVAEVAEKASQTGEMLAAEGKAAAEKTAESVRASAAKVVESAKGEVAEMMEKVRASASNLLSDPAVTTPVKDELNKLVESLSESNDGAASACLAKIVALKPSTEQMGLVKELGANLGAIVLGRNFDANDPASGGAVKQTIDAIRNKDTAGIVAGLGQIGSSAKLTDSQKEIITNLAGSFGGKLSNVMNKANEAAGKLKSLGF